MKGFNLVKIIAVSLVLAVAPAVFGDDDEISSVAASVQTVNINEANAESIAATLDGIGLSKARAIVAYREQNGTFTSKEELEMVRGIGKITIQKNEGRIVVGK